MCRKSNKQICIHAEECALPQIIQRRREEKIREMENKTTRNANQRDWPDR